MSISGQRLSRLFPMSAHVLVVLSSVLLGVGGQLEWRALGPSSSSSSSSDVVPAARRDAGLGYDTNRHRLLLFGGRTRRKSAEIVLGDTWSFNLTTNSWSEISTRVSPPPRFGFVSGVSDDYLYISTGQTTNNAYLNDMWRFDFKTDKWEELPAQDKPTYYSSSQWRIHQRHEVRPEYRYSAAGGIFENSSTFYLSLGFGDTKYDNTYSYKSDTRGWYTEDSNRSPYDPWFPHARYSHAGTMISPHELLIFGGCISGKGNGGHCPSSDSWIFNAKTKEWIDIDGCASGRTYAAMANLPIANGQRRTILYGGDETSFQVLTTIKSPPEQVAVFNPDTLTWALRTTSGDIPSKRWSAAMATGKQGIYLFGGINEKGGVLLNSVHVLVGDAITADSAPTHSPCKPTFFNLIVLHGVLMALGWGLFLPWGAFIARYLKHKTPLWFHLHRLFQVFGLLLGIGGLITGCLSVRSDHFSFIHGILGLVVTIIGILQPFIALLRPHTPEEGEHKLIGLIIWEFFHHWLGRAALVLAIINISLGFLLALSHFVIWMLWLIYVGLLFLSYIIAEACHKCKKDYGCLEKGKPDLKKSQAGIALKKQNLYLVKEPKSVGSYSKYSFDNPALDH